MVLTQRSVRAGTPENGFNEAALPAVLRNTGMIATLKVTLGTVVPEYRLEVSN